MVAVLSQESREKRKSKNKKKDKKEKDHLKQKPILRMKRSCVFLEDLRPGDTVLNRARKEGKPPKEHDAEYRILTIAHFNGEAEVDFYMAAPTRIVAVVEYWDGSVGERRWQNALGSEAIGRLALPILRPQSTEN